ncbi:MAG TPA: aldo/keto reductase [Acidimicrobiales bacterium]|jgi:aryl-alcohol dehydrogenase-like predicted oxidoreductase|nr:aldo/keto reductase [Acidimicrobiales bacterium]
MAVLGLGLAALGRPGYLTVDHGAAIGVDRSVEALRKHCLEVCDAAWAGGIRWFDAARSYGRAEQFLSEWLTGRGVEPDQITVSSKWGYTYTADWRVDAAVHEVKDHSAAALARQWPETEALLGPWLRLYQVHSATVESGILDDSQAHVALAGLGVPVGLSLSGPDQSEALHRALSIDVDGTPLFSAVQATWNLLEPSAGTALAEAKSAGWTVIVKEALANGRLAVTGPATAALGPRPDVTALAAALAQPWADVVLLGAATVPQLRSNLAALDGAASSDDDRWVTPAVDPQTYWRQRAAMEWT